MDNWPVVLADDSGIRPEGKPDECFYCHQKVGSLHGRTCVVVQKVVEYEVRGYQKGKEAPVGTFTRQEPYHWTDYDCEFHKNESSWCASNAVETIHWYDDAWSQEIKDRAERKDCCCGLLIFHFRRVVNPGPLRRE